MIQRVAWKDLEGPKAAHKTDNVMVDIHVSTILEKKTNTIYQFDLISYWCLTAAYKFWNS